MICATCSKTPAVTTIATKTRKVGEHTIVEAQREALVCDCGVIAWDPPRQTQPIVAPYRPSPFVPIPATPYQPYVPADFRSPNTPWRPTITC